MEELNNNTEPENWQQFIEARDNARNQLRADELLILKTLGGKPLSAEWQEKIERDRKAFADTWGMDGKYAREITKRYQQERKADEEMEAMYQAYLADESDREKIIRQQIDEVSHENRKQEAREILLREFTVIHEVYEHKNEDIPPATHRRINKRIEAFKQKWDGKEPEEDEPTLQEEDLAKQGKAWEDLMAQHEIITGLYGGPENMPADTRDWLEHEREDFSRKLQAYRVKEFQQQLQSIQERSSQRPQTPKPG